MNLTPIIFRETMIRTIREFFYQRDFHEVITPVLNRGLPLEPNIFAFSTEWNTVHDHQPLFLTTSPESGLKKMIAAGIGNCFAIGKCFRNVEASSDRHTPEFLMLEWYREGATYVEIMNDVSLLVRLLAQNPSVVYQHQTIDLSQPWHAYSLVDLYKQYAGFSYLDALDDARMSKYAANKGYVVDNATWEQLFNQIFLNEIEPHLGNNPCFVTDFPTKISPLCKSSSDNPEIAQRFELYIGGMEIANGNTENTDQSVVRRHFETEKIHRERNDRINPPIDETFINALDRMNNQSYAGIGLGIDRLAMLLANTSTIDQIDPLLVR